MKRFVTSIVALSLAFALYNAAQVKADIKKPIAAPKVSIDAAARVILERAAKLYGSKPEWSGTISLSTEDSKKVSIAFERPKKLRIEQKGEGEYRLIVTDGQQVSDYSNGVAGESLESSSMPMPIEKMLVTSSSTSAPGTGIVPVLALFLNGKTGLGGPEFQEKKNGATTVTIKRLTDAPWKSQKCQRVLTDIQFTPAYDLDVTQHREEWWFSAEGKLVKVIGFKLLKADNGVPADKWNDEIVAQNFAPIFNSKTFFFNPPKSKN